MKTNSNLFKINVLCSLSFLFLSSLSFSQTSTTYQISGYCYTPTPALRIGNWDNTGYMENVVVRGNYAYTLDYYDGLRIIDIQDPIEPVEIYRNKTTSYYFDLAVNGNYVYVGGYKGLEILDASNPTNPIKISTDTSTEIYDIAIDESYAYLASYNSGLRIMDIHDPNNLIQVGSYTTSQPINRVFIQGQYAYILAYTYDSSLVQIIDVSNPTNPVKVNQYDVFGYVSGFSVNENYVFLGNYSTTSLLHILDIQNPLDIHEIGYMTLSDSGYSVVMRGKYAYLANGSSGLTVIDLSNPSVPNVVDSIETPGIAIDMDIQQNYAYLANYYSGLQIIKINNPLSNLSLSVSGDTDIILSTDSTGYYELNNLPFGNYTVQPYKEYYIFNPEYRNYSGLNIALNDQDYWGYPSSTNNLPNTPVNLSPENGEIGVGLSPLLIASNFIGTDGDLHESSQWQLDNSNDFSEIIYNSGELTKSTSITIPLGYLTNAKQYCWRVRYKDNHGNWSDWSNATYFSTLSASNFQINGVCAHLPYGGLYSEIGHADTPRYSKFVRVKGKYAYVLGYNYGLKIFDISNPSSPVKIGSYYVSGEVLGMAVNENYVYIANGYKLVILDISNPAYPVEVSTFHSMGYVNDVAIKDNKAYLAIWYYGLQIVDVSNSLNPIELGRSTTTNIYSNSISVQGNYACIADQNYGLRIFDISDPASIKEVGKTNIYNGREVAVNDKYAFLIDSYSSNYGDAYLRIIDISVVSKLTTVGSYSLFDWYYLSSYGFQLEANGNYLFIADINYGLRVLNIYQPSNPVLMGYYNVPGTAVDATVQGGYAYLAGLYTGLKILQIAEPIPNATITLSGDTFRTVSSECTGYFEFKEVSAGNYTLKPTNENNTFTPIQYSYDNLSSNQWSQNFIGFGIITVTFLTNPPNQIVNINEVGYLTPYTLVTTEGIPFSINVDTTIAIDSGIQLIFKTWDDNTNRSHFVYPVSDTTYTVSFDTQYLLITQSNPVNGGAVLPRTRWYYAQSTVTCTAFPNTNFQFDQWTGDLVGNSNPSAILMNNPKSIQAYFSQITNQIYTLSGYCHTLSSLSHITQIADFNTRGEVQSIAIQGNYAYIADGYYGLRIIDMSDYSNPTEVGYYDTRGYAHSVTIQGNYAFVADDTTGLRIFYISDPAHPLEVGYYDTPGTAYDVIVNKNYAYVADDTTGLRIIDIINPANPFEIGYFKPDSASIYYVRKVKTYKNFLYLTGPFSYKFDILDISAPSYPSLVTTVNVGGYINGMDFQNDSLYLASSGDPSYPLFQIGQPPGLLIADISNPSTFMTVSYFTTESSPKDIAVDGNYAFLLHGGIKEINISSPTDPTEISTYTTSGNSLILHSNFAFIADGYSGMRIITIYDPLENVTMILSGNSSIQTSTDTTGYYAISHLAYGNYIVKPYKQNYIFSPIQRIYEGLMYDHIAENYSGTFSESTIIIGNFDSEEELTNWAFEPLSGFSSQPSIDWNNNSFDRHGLLTIEFSTTSTQAVKITSKFQYTLDSSNSWHTMRVIYYCDTSPNQFEILGTILLYPNNTSYKIQEIGATYKSKGLVQAGNWYTLEVPVYCRSSSGQLQLTIKNNGTAGNLYIDSIELVQSTLPAVNNPTYVSTPYGDFDNSTDITHWAIENPPGNSTPNGLPALSWSTGIGEQQGVLSINFSTTNQGAKLTSLETYSIPTNRSSILSFKVYTPLGVPGSIHIIGYLYSVLNEKTYTWDLGAYANLGSFAGDSWTTFYVPLTSLSNSTDRIQFIIKNTSQAPVNVYLDDIQLFYDGRQSTNPKQNLLIHKENNLIDSALFN